MRILFLTQIIPYPPDAGPRIKTWHVLRYLADRGNQITLVAFMRPEEKPHIAALEKICDAVYPVPIARSRIKDIAYWLRSQIKGRPFLIERDDLANMRALVNHLLKTQKFDFIHADQLTMAQFAFSPQMVTRRQEKGLDLDISNHTIQRQSIHSQPKLIFDAHNAVWTIMDRMSQTMPWYTRDLARLESRRIKQYEGWIVKTFDHTLAVTDQDRNYLLEAVDQAGGNEHSKSPTISVIPIAVDASAIQPISRRSQSKNLLTLGTLHYPPNADGIRWFAKEVFPLIHQHAQDTRLIIIGKNPPSDLIQLSKDNPDKFEITGYVPDLRPYLENAAMVIVPVRAGSGMRVRILESFAWAMPVVTTSVGLEGINAQAERDVLVADDAPKFSEAVLRLLRDVNLQSELSRNGRWLAENYYDWRIVLKKMDVIYEN